MALSGGEKLSVITLFGRFKNRVASVFLLNNEPIPSRVEVVERNIKVVSLGCRFSFQMNRVKFAYFYNFVFHEAHSGPTFATSSRLALKPAIECK